MSRIGNTLNMLRILSTGRKFSIKELSAILEVSPRMIRQYKDDLEQAGIYIETIMGKNGGYIYNGNQNFVQSLSLEDLRLAEDIRLMLHNSNNISERIKIGMDALIDKIRFLTVIQNNKYSKYNIDKERITALIDNTNRRKEITIKLVDNPKRKMTFIPLFYNLFNDCYYFTGRIKSNNEMRTFSQFEIVII